MKKELLIASALAGSLGVAGVADAATGTFSGKTRTGVKSQDTDAGTDATVNEHQASSFSVSISETTDAGMKVSTGFTLSDESDGSTDPSGLTLTFTNGAKLDLIEAGNAYATHLATVPSASGEQSISDISTNMAPTGLTYGNQSDSIGFEFHTAADAFGVEGLKAGVSWSEADSSASTTTHTTESAASVGASYVTTAGDSTVTVGGGIIAANSTSTTATIDASSGMAVSLSAVTGDLTVGIGFASGDYIASNADATSETSTANAVQVTDVSVMTAGVKYVSGDMTFNLGYSTGDGTDSAIAATAAGSADNQQSTSASLDYTLASGVTATFGYTDVGNNDEGVSKSGNSGTSWYLGANVSF